MKIIGVDTSNYMKQNKIEINFAITSFPARSSILSSEAVYNCYVKAAPPDSPFKTVVYNTAGLKEWLDLSLFQRVYSALVMGNYLYVVAGTNVYKIDAQRNITLLGSLPTSPAPVMMTDNGVQVTILTDAGSAFYTTGTTLTQISDPDYISASSVCTIGGYSIYSIPNSSTFFISKNGDTSVYSPNDYRAAERSSDYIVRCFADHGELWIFKQRTIEIFYLSGNPDFPFDPIQGAFIERGCAAKYSVCSDQIAGIIWLGDDNVVYSSVGYQPEAISTDGIHTTINKISKEYGVSDAFATIYTQEGSIFYNLTFPSAGITISYDFTMRLWHTRGSKLIDSNTQSIWRASCVIPFAGRILVGDYYVGKLFELDLDIFTEDNQLITRKLVSATQWYKDRIRICNLSLLMETGIGILNVDENPMIGLEVCTDGKTFGMMDERSLGQQGAYYQEVEWSNLGYEKMFIFRITTTNKARFALLQALLDVEV